MGIVCTAASITTCPDDLYILNMPVTDNQQAGSPARTGTGNISVLNTDVSKTSLTRAILFALALGLYHGSLYAQPAGPGTPGDTPSGGISRPGDFVPALPQPGIPPEAPIEVPGEAVPEEKEPVPEE